MDNGTARPERPRVLGILASAALAALLLASCDGTQEGDGVARGAPATSGPAATPVQAVPSAPLREAREGWKVFADPARLVSFELPEAWVVQPLEPEAGDYAPGSLHYAVRTPEGTTAAELHTGIGEPAPCADAERTPYYVLRSEPLEVGGPPAGTGIEPRFVVRLISGFRYFGAYGITDEVGGADGLACVLPNTVRGREALGRFSFGDLEVLAPRAPAETGPGTLSFGTIGEAEAYFDTPEFATISEMIRSIRVGPAAVG